MRRVREDKVMRVSWLMAAALLFAAGLLAQQQPLGVRPPHAKQRAKHSVRRVGSSGALPSGKSMIWEERGELTPSKVYWAAASEQKDPLSRLPAPPFSKPEKDTTPNAVSPKIWLKDSKGIKWTVKFGDKAHSDVVAPRLAWALGYGTVESYYLETGRIEGVAETTDLGKAKRFIKPDGSFTGGARFKRHDKEFAPIKDARGRDVNWDEAHNPGVPPEQLSGLMIFDALVRNWDAQPKNNKVYRLKAAGESENWYIESDMGATFADRPQRKFILSAYRNQPSFVEAVGSNYVWINYTDAIRSLQSLHRRIPLAHAQWFRGQLAKLTDDDIRAAFDAGFATPTLNEAYASGDLDRIRTTRERELSAETRQEIEAYVAVVRARISEFTQKVPPAQVTSSSVPSSR